MGISIADRHNPSLQMKVNTDGSIDVNSNASTNDLLSSYTFNAYDDTTTTNIVYILNIKNDGGWYIAQFNSVNKTFLYCKGNSNYTTAWASKQLQDYDYFDEVF